MLTSNHPFLTTPLLSCPVVLVDSCIAYASPAPKLGSYHHLLLHHPCFARANAIVDAAVLLPSPHSQWQYCRMSLPKSCWINLALPSSMPTVYHPCRRCHCCIALAYLLLCPGKTTMPGPGRCRHPQRIKNRLDQSSKQPAPPHRCRCRRRQIERGQG